VSISNAILLGERSFKPTSTASQLILVHSSTTTIRPQRHNSVPTTTHNATTSPSPLMRDVGSTTNTPGCAEQTAATPAPPLSKGMWAGLYSTGGIGGNRRRNGGWKNKGGPRNWEAHTVRHEMNHNLPSWFVSPILRSISPPLITLDPNTSSCNNNHGSCNNNGEEEAAPLQRR
jgi:hypothetical protein